MQSLPHPYRACVIGASGAIGTAILAQLQADPACQLAIGLHRHSQPHLDLSDEASIASAAESIRAQGPFHLIILATGILHTQDFMPEKKLGDLHFAQMQQTFLVNTLGPAMVIRYFSPLLNRERSTMALLSAKVGSIEDNRLGGWYSYRASKAALNMMIKTAAIELKRSNPQASLIAVHPGTVNSALSKPFKGEQIGRSPSLAAQEILATLDAIKPEETGIFVAYDSERLPW